MTLTASAAVVVDDDAVTLVDPGSVGELDQLARVVESRGLPWESITQVFYTHLHFDHYDLCHWPAFIERVLVPAREVDYIRQLMSFREYPEQYRDYLQTTHERIARPFLRQFVHYRHDHRYSDEALAANEKLVHYDGEARISKHTYSLPLPGHCVGLHGLVVDGSVTEMGSGKGIIASDAVLSESDWRANDINLHMILNDSKAWFATRELLKQFDWILPGHGDAFMSGNRTAQSARTDSDTLVTTPMTTLIATH